MNLRQWLAQRDSQQKGQQQGRRDAWPEAATSTNTDTLADTLDGTLPPRLFAALLDSLDEGVLVVDRAHHIVYLNGAARHILALHEPLPLSADYIPADRTLRDALAAAGRGVPTQAVEFALGDQTLSLTARPLADGYAALTLSELTHVRRLEAVRRDFVANVSHELRTPLTVIGGFAETLNDADATPEEQRRFASIILANTRRMQGIVDELLDLSRIESGGWIPKPTATDLRDVATDAIAASQEAAMAKGVVLTTEIAPNARGVYADRTALRQVIGNLIENAVRHTTTGQITVLASHAPEGGTWVHVRDTGAGIAPEHLPRIFERFYRVDTGRAREAGGTGLGLAIVKHLVEAHGGCVQAESTLGQGTTVSAYFPPPAIGDPL